MSVPPSPHPDDLRHDQGLSWQTRPAYGSYSSNPSSMPPQAAPPHPYYVPPPHPYPHYPWPPEHAPGYPSSVNSIPFPVSDPHPGPSTPARVPLANATSASVNQPTPAPPPTLPKRTRVNATSGSSRARKRPRTGVSAPAAPAVYGVGPSSEPVEDLPTVLPPSYGSASDKRHDTAQTGASDVWYFCIPVDTKVKPACWEKPADDKTHKQKPSSEYVACRFCWDHDKVYRAWKCQNGQTGTIRDHLRKHHRGIWEATITALRLKGWEELVSSTKPVSADDPMEPFTLEGFHERLLRWVVVDDQSVNVVNCPELRSLLLYLGVNLIDDKDIPHRTKLSELIIERYRIAYLKMLAEVQDDALGRRSYTSDIWSNRSLASFMAVTMHYSVKVNGRLETRSRLVAFREVPFSHTGENLANAFVQILREFKGLHEIGVITLDNASNCAKMMEFLEKILNDMGIAFDRNGNRIRCFPHVINIAVKAGLKALTRLPPDEQTVSASLDTETLAPVVPDVGDEPWDAADLSAELNAALQSDNSYRVALESDPVVACRSLVTACRASGLRRGDLRAVITDGNEQGIFTIEVKNEVTGAVRLVTITLPELQLLKDVDTRWSATYFMIDRVLQLWPAIKLFLEQPRQRDIAHHMLTTDQITVLRDIRSFLKVPHIVQEILSAEKTPTLPLSLPLYEKVIVMLKLLERRIPRIAHAICATRTKIEQYMKLSRTTRVFALAMVINPMIKFKWLEDNWTVRECESAKKFTRDAMMQYRKETRSAGATHSRTPTASASTPTPSTRAAAPVAVVSRASVAMQSGLSRLDELERELSFGSLDGTANAPDPSPPSSSSPGLSEAEIAVIRLREEQEDTAAVAEELNRYVAAGTKDGNLHHADLLAFWQDNDKAYPLLYRIALDVLPMQASAVPCERVFSSSKETVTERRANLSPKMMEILQVLKFLYKRERLNFMEDVTVTVDELAQKEVSPALVDELILSGKGEELLTLLSDVERGV